MAKLTKAQLSAASKAGHAAGKPTSPAYKAAFRKKLASMRGGASRARGKVKSAARSAGRRAKSRASSGAKRVYHKSKQSLFNMSVGQAVDALPAVGGFINAGKAFLQNRRYYSGQAGGGLGIIVNGGGLQLDRHAAKVVVEPLVNGLVDSVYINKLRTSSLTPTALKTVAAARPLKSGGLKGVMKINLGQIVDAMPAAGGWAFSGKRLLTDAYYSQGLIHFDDNLAPSVNRDTLLSKYAPPVIGSGTSKIAHAARTSALVPAPMKRLFSLHA